MMTFFSSLLEQKCPAESTHPPARLPSETLEHRQSDLDRSAPLIMNEGHRGAALPTISPRLTTQLRFSGKRSMSATLTWLDLTASDRDRMRQVLDLFREQGTVDEMGLAASATRFPKPCFPEPPRFKRDCVTCCSCRGYTGSSKQGEPPPPTSRHNCGRLSSTLSARFLRTARPRA